MALRRRSPNDIVSAAIQNRDATMSMLQSRLASTSGTDLTLGVGLGKKRLSAAGTELNTEKRGRSLSGDIGKANAVSQLQADGEASEKEQARPAKPASLPPAQIRKTAPRDEVSDILSGPNASHVGGVGTMLRTGLKPSTLRSLDRSKLFSTTEGLASPSNPVFQFLVKLRADLSTLEFVYLRLIKRDIKASYNPFDLEIVPHAQIDPRDYFTLSSAGVTHFCNGEADFTALDQWEREFRLFTKVMTIPFFVKYRQWKNFYLWKAWIRGKKRAYCKSVLRSSLFCLDSVLRASLLEVRKICYKVTSLRMCKFSKNDTFSVESFAQAQQIQRDATLQKLEQMFVQIKQSVRQACDDFMEKEDPNEKPPVGTASALGATGTGKGSLDRAGMAGAGAGTSAGGGLAAGTASALSGEDSGPMSYTQLSAKRAKCRRLFKYIRFVDFLVIDSLFSVTRMSVTDILNHLKTLYDAYHAQLDAIAAAAAAGGTASVSTPSQSRPDNVLMGIGEIGEGVGSSALVGGGISSAAPIFATEVLFKDDSLNFAPSKDGYLSTFDTAVKLYMDATCEVPRLMALDDFQNFIQPAVSDRSEEVELGDGPDILSMFGEDEEFNRLCEGIRDFIRRGFDDVDQYAEQFEDFRRMFLENRKMDIYQIRQEDHPLEYFSESISKYKSQISSVNAMPTSNTVGVFLVDSAKLKETLVPSPLNCLKDIQDLLPVLAKAKNEALLSDLSIANQMLGSTPASVEEFVEYLQYLQSVIDRVPELDERYQNVCDIYALLDEHKIKVPPDEYAMFNMGTVPKFSMLKTTLQFSEDGREENINKFADVLENLVVQLRKDVHRIVQSSRTEVLNNPKGDFGDALRFASKLQQELTELREKSKRYVEFQAMFSRPLATFDDLDEAVGEIGLKYKLFKSIEEWSQLVVQWHGSKFFSIDVELLTNETTRFNKTVFQIQKGLPENRVVPILKERVDEMRFAVPPIADLRNESLKPRHWDQIKELLSGFEPNDEITLGDVLALKVAEKKDAVGQISLMASQESALEELLKKVAGQWQQTDFTVLPHKDSRDVYILGGVDDIIAQIEDSSLTIATIQGSRFVGPIKKQVDQWYSDIRLMGETLEEWLTCQRNWLYLESIFSAPDIQKQLVSESKMFNQVDKSFKDLMRKTNDNSSVYRALTQPGLLEKLQHHNSQLEKIQKSLEDYLEDKRMRFPRFYFLSNDDLLEILSQTANPLAVQPHMSKCFDNIKKLEFGANAVDILAMTSSEGETVSLGKNLKARNKVEDWLGAVEKAMVVELRKLHKVAVADYEQKPREVWIMDHCAQVVLNVSQIFWAKRVTECLEGSGGSAAVVAGAKAAHSNSHAALKQFLQENVVTLGKSAALTRKDLTGLQRGTLSALIVIDVHARDILDEMIQKTIASVSDFGWIKQLRYYWDTEEDDCFVRQTNSSFRYGYEYLGCQPRLVITPLTDRIYMTLTGALHLKLGGAPAGPAGTGKTETTKDLAKSLGRQCVVFNCSEGVTFKMMAKFFAGLLQTGAWICFDEFNRINIEVLSVVASQLLTIRNALLSEADTMIFDGKEMRVRRTMGVFITMNPGYAGRTELPDNLKVLFRPVACMIPDYRMIAEVVLFSEGFENAKTLSQKMVQLYKLSSEQLSSQDHYDFGMRAVKSVLVMAGSLKRANPQIVEDLLLIRAMRDSNIPKFVAEDVPLFQAIVQDLFPGVNLPEHDYGELQTSIEEQLEKEHRVRVPRFIMKVIQLYETLNVRHGVMLVGPTGGGKTTCRTILASALTSLREEKNASSSSFQKVHVHELNPKSITYAELYGAFNLTTMEWSDGIVPHIAHEVVADTSADKKWIVFDGPVDTLWIESMNSVLDDSKLLCLDNGDRIKLTNTVSLMFEVQDLAVASPATVSRCGMVFIDPVDLPWDAPVSRWMQTRLGSMVPELRQHLWGVFRRFVASVLQFLKKNCRMDVQAVDINLVQSCCDLFGAMLDAQKTDVSLNSDRLKRLLDYTFTFSFIWSFGGNLSGASQDSFDTFCRESLEGFVNIPSSGSVFDYFVDFSGDVVFRSWSSIVPEFKYAPGTPFFKIMVPTVDTVRYSYLLKTLVNAQKPVLFNGNTGVGKSMIVSSCLTADAHSMGIDLVTVQFSAQTSAGRTQEMIESKLEKKRKNIMGAPPGKRIVLFVDDLNMPKLEQFGAQPPIELLRQLLGSGGFYDPKKLFWKIVEDVNLVAACGPPGGGRNPTTPRFLRLFHLLCIPDLSIDNMKRVFSSILNGFFEPFTSDVRQMVKGFVAAGVELYTRIIEDLRPTPTRSHYVFNLRDLAKVFQGMMQVSPRTVSATDTAVRLWLHESMRCFYDRLINEDDRRYFRDLCLDLCRRHVGVTLEAEDAFPKGSLPLLFGDFMKVGVPREDRVYEMITDIKKLMKVMEDYLDEYNMSSSKQMNLVFFTDAVSHVCRIARILRQERGNAVLVGVGGSGKQSLTRLASAMNEYKCFQIELSRGYGANEFREDLKKLFTMAGVEGKPVTFLLSDNQIVQESFLEDVNNILNSGEVPNLFAADEKEKIISDVRPFAREAGLGEGRDVVYAYFVQRVRTNLHIVLCMSPVGDAFRTRVRMFPSLVNCCSIDWFDQWPDEALYSVARRDLEEMDVGADAVRDALSLMCVQIHSSVSSVAEQFYAELRRRFYVTPTSYLDFIALYKTMLTEKRDELCQARDRLKNGLTKLKESNELVAIMRQDLEALQPVLIQKTEETARLLERVGIDTARANEQRKVIAAEEAVVNEKTAEAEAIAADAQKDLDEALPALEKAVKALDSLNKNDITEMKAYKQPPKLVVLVMEAVLVLRNEKKVDWDNAKVVLGNSNFLKECKDFDKDNIPDPTIKKLQVYVRNPEFDPETVGKQSLAAKSLCMWVQAMDLYHRVAKNVEPKRQVLNEAKSKLKVMQDQLAEKQTMLAKVEHELKELQMLYETSMREKAELAQKLDISEKRLNRAGKLTSALASEEARWGISVESLNKAIEGLPGSIFLSAAFIAYCGPFTAQYRRLLVDQWRSSCSANGIPIAEDFSLINTLSNPVTSREWQIWGLPTDPLSLENGILTTRTRRWPLMIDPQGQANRWIRNMEAKNGLKVIKRTEAANALRTLENAVRIGQPVLMEDVGEELDPALDPLLMKQVFKQGQRLLIRLGDSDVDYDPNFRFYMTTKLPNPHYLPEVCIKVTLINFTVTRKGLEDQLLADAVRKERPDLEERKDRLITSMAADKKQLKDIEDKILRMLSESEGELLDNEALINTLNDSKVTSGVIAERVAESEEMELAINTNREAYRPLATRGSILYFVMADLSMIDPMYQYSLDYFKKLFNLVIDTAEANKSTHVPTRLTILQSVLTETVYANVCRGLFEKDKIIFSFLICVQIKRDDGSVLPEEWEFLLRMAPMQAGAGVPPNADPSWISENIWGCVVAASRNVPALQGLVQSVASNPRQWRSWYLHAEPHNAPLPTISSPADPQSAVSLTPFQRMIVTRVFREEKFFFAVSSFVLAELGKSFVESPPFDLGRALADSSPATPIIFVLSAGADPTSTLLRFAKEKMNYADRMHIISLGQGQGPNAIKLIQHGRRSGDWVVLQNCHLGVSFMGDLERIINEFEQPGADLHPDFRLWLTSMPSDKFPIPVLQNGVKLTTEPPKGLRANLLRSYGELSSDYLECFANNKKEFGGPDRSTRSHAFKKLLFGLCFFHALIQERRKFGPLGWNVRYEFNSSDLEVSQSWLRMFLEEQPVIPWESLRYVIGEVNYGGRVTDGWDRRCLNAILKSFFSSHILQDSHKFSPSGIFFAPSSTSSLEDYVEYLEALPFADDPQVFGMHENANIVFQQQESQRMMDTVMLLQPRTASVGGSSSGSGNQQNKKKSVDQLVSEIAEQILQDLPPLLTAEEAAHRIFDVNEQGIMHSLSTVLQHEMHRFNKLLKVVRQSLLELQKALKGLVVLSAELDLVLQALLSNKVPAVWAASAYPSLKPLGSWVKDLVARVAFVRQWLTSGAPAAFWMSGLFFPQGFLTGVLQAHARKHVVAIDTLGFAFRPIERDVSELKLGPEDGVYVYGLFVDGARWDARRSVLEDAIPGENVSKVSVLHFLPTANYVSPASTYSCPLYKTSERKGNLSTTGHSTNYVLTIDLPVPPGVDPDMFVLRGTALLCQTDL